MPDLPIGIVGGMGPWAGFELCRHITSHTRAQRDQEHLTLYLASEPALVPDRTEYLLGNGRINPADVVAATIGRLAQIGARVVGIACNTIHAPAYWQRILELLAGGQIDIRLISIVEAVAEHLSSRYAPGSRIGVLGTAGTVATNIYGPALARRGFAVHYPGEAQVAAVHRAIYDPRFGIKSHFDPVPDAARREVEDAIVGLAESGVEAVVLGCTELPFAVSSAAKWARAGAGSGAAARARARRSGGAGALALRPDQSRNDAYFGARMAALSSS